MITLENAKKYLRVEYEDDDSYIEDLINVATDYLRDAITDYDSKLENKAFENKSNMTALTIVQNLYDERYMQGQELKTSYIVQSLINQMEYGSFEVIDHV